MMTTMMMMMMVWVFGERGQGGDSGERRRKELPAFVSSLCLLRSAAECRLPAARDGVWGFAWEEEQQSDIFLIHKVQVIQIFHLLFQLVSSQPFSFFFFFFFVAI